MNTEDFKRPDHTDFKDSSELKKERWSGVRHNKILTCYEFWILGEVVKSVTETEIANDELALTRAHMEVFKL